MPITLFPSYPTQQAFSINAIARACDLRAMRNLNDLPHKVRKSDELAQFAAQLVAKNVKQITSTKMLHVISDLKHSTGIPTSMLFPQLGICGQELYNKPTILKAVYGPYARNVAERLAQLPAEKVFFYLSSHDEYCDAAFLSQLAIRPELAKFKFLMTRPVDGEVYDKRRHKLQGGGVNKQRPVNPVFDHAIIQFTYQHWRSYKAGVDYGAPVKAALKGGAFVIFN